MSESEIVWNPMSQQPEPARLRVTVTDTRGRVLFVGEPATPADTLQIEHVDGQPARLICNIPDMTNARNRT